MTYLEPDWPAPANVTALMTLRGADHEALLEDSFAGKRLAVIQQVHGVDAVEATDSAATPEADASYSRSAEIGCRIVTADCLPLLVCNEEGTEIAAIHAGWRGLAGGVIENTLAQLNSRPEDLLIWMGPAISQQHFEVGPEVRQAFLNGSPAHTDAIADCFESHGSKYLADLYRIACVRIRACGDAQIFGGTECTFADARRYYSWRRDASSGRMHSAICFS